ncbi:hypothetical protein AMS68_007986 [Peltaster fructicola]|uniref:F-box domain-containing protein n=1 Tax=Peltaster fructicola TaxID=286661 RepID=A0A6H0Y6L7_9PEZI|nr:hypothetical protein AMS68_007986 [Peltaster fructicola]
MGLFKSLRAKVRKDDTPATTYTHASRSTPAHDPTARLPTGVLEIILSYVCPHSQDHTYQSSEQSPIGDGCMLCDLRDLAHCAQVCKKWYTVAQKVLYTSIRIDAVHYCVLEEELAAKRKKAAKHFRSKSHIDPVDVPGIRLGLLAQTLRDNRHLAQQTQILKLPYMTRESYKADLARAVSALPNLRYVDLPDGFYTGDSSCQSIREELQAQCSALRKMIYRAGTEQYLEFLLQRHWQQIEILELSGITVEPGIMQLVLASLPALRELTVSDLPWLDDTVFDPSSAYAPFVPLHTLKLIDVPSITAEGLLEYLSISRNKDSLRSLSLQDTGVTITDLHAVLWKASALEHLSINEAVSKSLAMSKDLPSLTSISLKVLNFEVITAEGVHSMQQPTDSYYAYLASSLHASALPALETLYVREQMFPERLLQPPHLGIGRPASRGTNNLSVYAQPFPTQRSSFNQTLEVFAKGIDELEWVFTAIAPDARSQNRLSTASGGRPLSAYSASRGLGPQWAQGGFGGEARRSVVVSNGFGGYLAVPSDELPGSLGGDARNDSAGHFLQPPPNMSTLTGSSKTVEKRGSKHDLWR